MAIKLEGICQFCSQQGHNEVTTSNQRFLATILICDTVGVPDERKSLSTSH